MTEDGNTLETSEKKDVDGLENEQKYRNLLTDQPVCPLPLDTDLLEGARGQTQLPNDKEHHHKNAGK